MGWSRRAAPSWNPVKELKDEIGCVVYFVRRCIVESGEGIERTDEQARKLIEALWNPVKELKAALAWIGTIGWALAWNPVKELKDIQPSSRRMVRASSWNPVKELKAQY